MIVSSLRISLFLLHTVFPTTASINACSIGECFQTGHFLCGQLNLCCFCSLDDVTLLGGSDDGLSTLGNNWVQRYGDFADNSLTNLRMILPNLRIIPFFTFFSQQKCVILHANDKLYEKTTYIYNGFIAVFQFCSI